MNYICGPSLQNESEVAHREMVQITSECDFHKNYGFLVFEIFRFYMTQFINKNH